jgi:PAS domain S-box-containing protein
MALDSSIDSGRPDLSPTLLPRLGQDLFPTILNTLEEPFFLLDTSYKFYWHNRACNSLYKSISGKNIDKNFDFNVLLTKEQREVFRQHLETVAAGEKVHIEWRYQITVIKWVSVSLYPFHAADGTFVGVCGSLRDITEKKLTELVLLRNTAVLNNIGEGVLLVDAQFRVLTFNKQAIRIFSLLETEVHTGADLLALLPASRRPTVRWFLQQALSGTQKEYEIEYPDGLWLFTSYMPVRNHHGNIEQVSISFRDISKRKKIEEQLREGEVRYQTLVNSLSEGVILQTLDRQVLAVNKSALAILDIDTDKLKASGFPSPGVILFDEHENQISHHELLYKRNGQLHGIRNKIVGIQQSSGIQWLKVNTAIVTNAGEKDPYTLLISFDDITREKKISSEMEVLSLLARETSNAVIILHPNGELLWMNEGFSRLTGYSPDELIGKTSLMFMLGPETDLNVVKQAAYCRLHGMPFKGEFQSYTKGGKKLWTRVQGQSISQSKGPVHNYFLVITDVTEEKKTREELEVLSMVAKETNNGVIIFDKLSGNVLWANEGFTRLTGYTSEDIIGKNPVLTMQGPDTDMEQVMAWADRIEHNLSYSGDFITYTKAGEKKIHHVTGQPFQDENGEITRYFVVSHDVTDQRRMEEERLQNEIEQQKRITHVMMETKELERNQLGRELHDNINQILAATRMQLSYCLDNFSICEPVLRQCRDNVMMAIEETRRLSHRMVMPQFTERTLPQVLKNMVEHYQYTQPIQLDITGWDDGSVNIPVKEAFFRIAQEQMSNIYKHARATEVIIQIACDPRMASLTIKDNGVGFDPCDKKDGIGLSNIRSRAEWCEGTAQFITARGNGCTLVVKVPVTSSQQSLPA